MTTYERIRFNRIRVRYNGKQIKEPRTIILMNPSETKLFGAPALTGSEVDREGREVAPRGVDQRQHIIGLDLIIRRTPLTMSKTYGTLEEEQ